MTRWSANLLLLFAGAVWGLGFVAQQTAMQDVGPFSFIAMRFFIASILLVPFAIRENRLPKEALPPMNSGFLLQYAIIGVCLFFGMATQQVGLMTITVTNSGFLTGLYVVITPFLTVLMFRQWPHPVVWPAALLAFAGIFLLSGGDMSALKTGDMLTVMSAAFFALQMVLIARWVRHSQRPLALALVQFLVTCTLASIVALLFESISIEAVRGAAKEIVFTGIFATGLAFSLQVIGQRYTTAPQAAIFLSSESLFAALFGALVLHERIGWIGLSGCALIFSAMLVVELVPELYRTKLQRRST